MGQLSCFALHPHRAVPLELFIGKALLAHSCCGEHQNIRGFSFSCLLRPDQLSCDTLPLVLCLFPTSTLGFIFFSKCPQPGLKCRNYSVGFSEPFPYKIWAPCSLEKGICLMPKTHPPNTPMGFQRTLPLKKSSVHPGQVHCRAGPRQTLTANEDRGWQLCICPSAAGCG